MNAQTLRRFSPLAFPFRRHRPDLLDERLISERLDDRNEPAADGFTLLARDQVADDLGILDPRNAGIAQRDRRRASGLGSFTRRP